MCSFNKVLTPHRDLSGIFPVSPTQGTACFYSFLHHCMPSCEWSISGDLISFQSFRPVVLKVKVEVKLSVRKLTICFLHYSISSFCCFPLFLLWPSSLPASISIFTSRSKQTITQDEPPQPPTSSHKRHSQRRKEKKQRN